MSCDWLKQSKGMLAGLDGAVFDDLDDACDPTYKYDCVIVGDDNFDKLRGYYEDIEGELDEGRQKQSPKLGASVSELRTWAEHATDMALLGLKYAFLQMKLHNERARYRRCIWTDCLRSTDLASQRWVRSFFSSTDF